MKPQLSANLLRWYKRRRKSLSLSPFPSLSSLSEVLSSNTYKMKFLIAFALIAAVSAQSPSSEYLPPQEPAPAHTFNKVDGYSYKKPTEQVAQYVAPAPVQHQYVAPAPVQPQYVAPAPVAQPQYVAPAPVAQPQYVAPAPVQQQYIPPAPVQQQQYYAPAPVAQPQYHAPAPVAQPQYYAPAPVAQPQYQAPAPVHVQTPAQTYIPAAVSQPLTIPAPVSQPIRVPAQIQTFAPVQPQMQIQKNPAPHVFHAPAEPAPAHTFNKADGYQYKVPDSRRYRF